MQTDDDDVRALAEAVADTDDMHYWQETLTDYCTGHRNVMVPPLVDSLRYALAAALPGWLARRAAEPSGAPGQLPAGLDAAAAAALRVIERHWDELHMPGADPVALIRAALAPHWPAAPTPAEAAEVLLAVLGRLDLRALNRLHGAMKLADDGHYETPEDVLRHPIRAVLDELGRAHTEADA